MNNTLIKAEVLTKTYRLYAEEVHAVRGVNFEIKTGEYVALMGPSGSGKTTLLDMIGCLDTITSGKLWIFDKNVSTISESRLANIRRGMIGFIFQDFSLIPSLTTLENVELARHFAGLKKDKRVSLDLIKEVGLGHRVNHLPKQMSGGEKQRAAIARALAVEPKVLLADEPTGHLDSDTAQGVFDLFARLNKEKDVTIIVATHNEQLGEQTRRTVHLRDGQIVNT
jgi:putative ABC transport system ATP-binding protein